MKKKYLKEFITRGLIFSGLGPIVLGIIYFLLGICLTDFSLSGTEVLLGIISTYLLAFVQAGASVFNQIEEWPLPKSLGIHLLSLYAVYSIFYLVNSWIPFDIGVFIIFTLIFLIVYFAIWLTVYLILKSVSKKINGKI